MLSRPILMPGESLPSLLGRYVRANWVCAGDVFDRDDVKHLLRERSISRQERESLAADLGLDPSEWARASYDPENQPQVGTLRVGAGHLDPLGWALAHHSSRCWACHEQGKPWNLIDQTGLSWICPHHHNYLQGICGSCVSFKRALAGAPMRCHHYPTPDPSRADHARLEKILNLQRAAQSELDDGVRHLGVPDLASLRAASVFALADAASRGRAGALSADAVAAATALFGQQRRGGHLQGVKFGRPAPSPWLNAHLAFAASQHWDEKALNFDPAWLTQVIADTSASNFPTARLWPYADHLGLTVGTERALHEVHPRWESLAAHLTNRLSSSGLRSINIPSALIDRQSENPLIDPWVVPLTRAALVIQTMTGRSLTAAVQELGHHFTSVTAVRLQLASPPTRRERQLFNDAVSHLTDAAPEDFSSRRRSQQHVKFVPTTVLRQFRLQPPSTARISQGGIAAAWLWCVATGSHLTTVPFLDGRATRYLAPAIHEWSQRQSSELLDLNTWNGQQVLMDSPQRSVAPPQTVRRAG